MTARKFLQDVTHGFTMIELLIVIAILGALTAVILVAINPAQKLAQARDAGRKSTVSQLGNAMAAYIVNDVNGRGVAQAAGWIGSAAGSLVASGEVSVVPGAVTYSISGVTACIGGAPQNGWCYSATAANGTTPLIIYTRLESNAYNGKCTAPALAWYEWSSAAGRGGTVCLAAEPTAAAPGTFID